MDTHTMLAIRNAQILAPNLLTERGTILIRNGRIEAIGPEAAVAIPDDCPTVDAVGLMAVPGFIDLQVNGGFGLDFTADPTTIWDVAAQLPQYGVTTFLPTIITAPLEKAAHGQHVLAGGPPEGFAGARPLGLHVEGPFLHRDKKGAHNPAHLRPPTIEAVANWSPETGVRLVTIAPELPGALGVIRHLVGQGVVVSAGHSMATYEQATAGFDAGITYATHLFNAMPNLHHRDPGLVAAALLDERITIGILADGLHVDPIADVIAWRLTGPDRFNLVTDAMAALGMPFGEYLLGDYAVTVEDNAARLADQTLAGCIVAMDEAIQNLITYTGCTLPEALATATTTPARLLGLVGELGTLTPGAAADLVLLLPDLRVCATFINGQCVYADAPERWGAAGPVYG